MPVMIVAALTCLLIFFTGHIISRWEGPLFPVHYLFYTLYLVLAAAQYAIFTGCSACDGGICIDANF